MFGSFDDFQKYLDYVKKEKEKAGGKGKWSLLFIYLLLISTLPLVLGASVFTYKMGQHYASLF